MTTGETVSKKAIADYFFVILVCVGITLLAMAILWGRADALFEFMMLSALGVILIGAGEWVNHPLQKSRTYSDADESSFIDIRHRKRCPSSLGNLLEIIGLILIFTGVAKIP